MRARPFRRLFRYEVVHTVLDTIGGRTFRFNEKGGQLMKHRHFTSCRARLWFTDARLWTAAALQQIADGGDSPSVCARFRSCAPRFAPL